MILLDLLAKHYVDLILQKHRHYDCWDVYWMADTPFWKREQLEVSRTASVHPYKPLPAGRLGKMILPDILCAAQELQENLEGLDGKCDGNAEIRRQYLLEHNRALIVRCRYLLGEQMTYDEYTMGMFGLVSPAWDPAPLRSALEELDRCLPGAGALESRMQTYRADIRIPRERVPDTMNTAARFFHDMGVRHMGIKDANMPRLRYRELGGKEFVTVLFGYDYDEITLEQNFGIDYPFAMDTLREIAGHELEPGHFTFMNLRTKGMVDTGYPELGLNSHSPSSALIEGFARVVVELSLDTPEKERAFDEQLLAVAGLDPALAQTLPAWRRYVWAANYGKLEIERRLWDGDWTRTQALAFAKENKIVGRDAAEQVLDTFAEDEGHFTSHDYCRDVVRAYLDTRCATTDEKWAVCTQLYQTPFRMTGIVDGSWDPFAFQA